MGFPVLIVDKSLDVVLPIIRERSNDQEIHHDAENVASDLDIDIKTEKPVTIKEDCGHQNTVRLEKRQCVPENVGVGCFQFILQESAN